MRVVWVDPEPPESFRYVRLGMALSNLRRGRPRWSGPGRLVAYADLSLDVLRDRAGAPFVRPVWWVRTSPRPDPYDAAYWPCEGVDPRTLAAGRWRLDGGLLEEAG